VEPEWTVTTLKAHYDAILEARNRELDRALAANDKRLDGLNEMRGIMSDSWAKFITRREAMAMMMFLIALIGLVFSLTKR
jgi:hypothetical protein